MACSYKWYIDNHPVALKKPELFVPDREKELLEQIERLKSIVESQASVIADYQEMMRCA
jgi:hypothetical protein